ncbi:MAG: cob(I)yrinic acid a,c-diamide adenosyltransferase [Asgard group archaeon]
MGQKKDRKEEGKNGLVILYTGSGEGKTITSLGLALRAIGHGYKVIMIQFMKGRKFIGEYRIQECLGLEFEIHQFGREDFINLEKPEPVDFELAKKGLSFAKEALNRKPYLLILDEINLATAVGLIKVDEVLDLLDDIPEETTVVLTGRHAHPELIDRADLVTFMVEVKHPFHKGVEARKGIEY